MTTHTSRFTSPVVEGRVVSGISEGTIESGHLKYRTEWSGIYEGIRPAESNGEPMHCFRDGVSGHTLAAAFAIPVSQFPVEGVPKDEAVKIVRETGLYSDAESAELVEMLPNADDSAYISTIRGQLRWNGNGQVYYLDETESGWI
jgi:hypothetical protein